ncbi:hypothetical protein CJF31_00011122 [Rutstroemia sp. NJR-2017a BVV2]|nr:hypothetical protein CJF31_00011122 [Rutstroemia sp. NJR-2017a BVV2]
MGPIFIFISISSNLPVQIPQFISFNMTRILLTGGNGFIAARILEILLKQGHSVVTTVRSQSKIDAIRSVFSSYSNDQLDFVILEEIAKPDAFDQAVISTPPFELVIHTASPCFVNAKDIQKEVIDPAVIGTVGILKAVQANAPSVTRVVITSSFVSVFDLSKGTRPGHVYTEKEWSTITHEEALSNPTIGYFASKAFAEKAAWNYVEENKPNFTLTTILPTLVFGPITQIPGIHSLSALNTSNQLIYGFTQGTAREKFPDFGGHVWVDVRDVAAAHVKAATIPEASGNRFIACGSPSYDYRMIVNIIKKSFPEYISVLPADDVQGGDFPADKGFAVDTSFSEKVLGIEFMGLERSIVDTVRSFQAAEMM